MREHLLRRVRSSSASLRSCLTLAQLSRRAGTLKHAPDSCQTLPLHGWLDDGMGNRIDTHGPRERLPWHVGMQV